MRSWLRRSGIKARGISISNTAILNPLDFKNRWIRLSLLELLAYCPTEESRQISASIQSDNAEFHGIWNDYYGSYMWLHTNKAGAALLYGGTQSHPEYWERGREIEEAARRRITKLPKAVAAMVEPQHPKSLGWTMAMWADGPESKWQDLTGEDPKCLAVAELSDGIVFAGSIRDACDWVLEEMEPPTNSQQAITAVLEGKPLTRKITNAFEDRCPIERILDTAAQLCYPVDSDL